MDWLVPVNEILEDNITRLNYSIFPPGFRGDVRSIRLMQENLSNIIDELGEQSSRAQGLNKVITSAEKLRNSLQHTLYLLKDSKGKGGKGEVIGFLKVGAKHLFLFNEQNKVCEVKPLCILDFYILQDRQRSGYGKILFDHMLLDMGIQAEELAIDGPSSKMEMFLYKNYGVERLLRQSNNFAVGPHFFSLVPPMSKSGHMSPLVTPAVGRFAASKPPSSIGKVIHGSGATAQETSNNGSSSNAATPDFNAPAAGYQEMQDDDDMIDVALKIEEELIDEDELQEGQERPSTLSVEPMADAPDCAESPAGSTTSRRDSQLTDRGYFDVKFYHNKLW